jgi:hypothetical protein
MATVYGVNYTKKNITVPSLKVAGKEHSGKVRMAFDSYVFEANVVASATIKLMKLPAGAKVVDCKVKVPSLGTTGIFSLGYEANGVDVADLDGFLLATSIDAGGQAVLGVPTLGSAAIFKEFSVETQVVLTQTEDTTAALGLAIEVAIFYTME